MVNFNNQEGFSILTNPEKCHRSWDLSDSSYNHVIDEEEYGESEFKNSLLPHTLSIDSSSSVEENIYKAIKSDSESCCMLIVQNVQLSHAGNYTCAPSNTRPTSITVHVIKKGDRYKIRSVDKCDVNINIFS